ncbi:hypothetical protein ABIC09_005855 [Bradyrhizobium sp. S3.12.5]|uniref:hypothetical protein n=1 Tax=Bradyrhizobium sp. S3.12.5 TaxID=3156386 RepID=UPI0033936768
MDGAATKPSEKRSGMMLDALACKLCLGLGGMDQAARKAKPLMIGIATRVKPVDAFLGAKRRSPRVMADQTEFPATYRTAFH